MTEIYSYDISFRSKAIIRLVSRIWKMIQFIHFRIPKILHTVFFHAVSYTYITNFLHLEE